MSSIPLAHAALNTSGCMAVMVSSFIREPVGVITFSHTKWVRQLDIHIGYVVPEHRGRGIYRAMWNRLVEEAQARDALVIWGNTHTDNAVMRATARALDRVERGVLLRFDVPPKAT